MSKIDSLARVLNVVPGRIIAHRIDSEKGVIRVVVDNGIKGSPLHEVPLSDLETPPIADPMVDPIHDQGREAEHDARGTADLSDAVDKLEAAAVTEPQEEPETAVSEDSGPTVPEWSPSMLKRELLPIAEQAGIDTNDKTKAEIVAALEALGE